MAEEQTDTIEDQENIEDEYVGEPPDDEMPEGPGDVDTGSAVADAVAQTGDEEEQAEQPEFDLQLLYLAKGAGIEEADARKYPSVRALENEMFRRVEEAKIADKKVADVKAAAEAAEAMPEKPTFDDMEAEITDPAMMKKLQEIDAYHEAKYKKLEEQAAKRTASDDEMKRLQAQDAQNTFFHHLDNFIKGATDLHDVLGDEPTNMLKPDSPQSNARIKLIHEIEAVGQIDSYERQVRGNQTQTPFDVLFRRAADNVFADNKQKRKDQKLASKLDDRRRQAIERPAGRKTSPDVDGDAKAIATAERMYRERGMPADSVEQDDEF